MDEFLSGIPVGFFVALFLVVVCSISCDIGAKEARKHAMAIADAMGHSDVATMIQEIK